MSSNFFLQLKRERNLQLIKMRKQKQRVLLAILIAILVVEAQQSLIWKWLLPKHHPHPPVIDANRFRPEDRFDRIEDRHGRRDWQQVHGRIGNWQANYGEFGFGSTYNSRWNRNVILLELDSNANQVYKYIFNLEAGLYELSFQWAAREGFPLQTSQLAVNFNGVEIHHLNPHNYDIQFFRSHVNAIHGVNVLELIARGPSDHFGASVGYFSLVKL